MDNKIINFAEAKQAQEQIQENKILNTELQEKRKVAISKLPRYRGEVASKNNIRTLPDVQPGQIFWVTMDNKAYLVTEKVGRKLTIKALDETATISTGITIYDMNKSLVSKELLFDWNDTNAVNILSDSLLHWFNNDDFNDKYYLLYGRNMHYVSLLKLDTVLDSNNINVLFDTIKNAGNLISVDFNTSDGEYCIEIWVRTQQSAAELLYLFPYDKGIIIL